MIRLSFIPTEFEDTKVEGQIPFDRENPWLLLHVGRFAEENREYYNQICKEKICIYVNDLKINVNDWNCCELKEEDNVKVVNRIEGGGGGILQIALGVALIVGGLMTGNPLLVAAGVNAGMLTLTGAIVLMGVSLLLGGLLQMLFAPTMPSMPTFGSGSTSPSYSWDGAQTTTLIDRPIGVVYGEYSVGGNIITAFVTTDGDKNYLNVLVGLSEGEIEGIMKADGTGVCTSTSDIPNIDINNQAITSYGGVTWDYRLGTNTQTSLPGFNYTHTFYSDSRKIGGSGIVYTTNGNTLNEINLQLEIPALYGSDGNGIPIENTVKYKVEYKLHSAPVSSYILASCTSTGDNPQWTAWNSGLIASGSGATKEVWIRGYRAYSQKLAPTIYIDPWGREKGVDPGYDQTPHPEPNRYLSGVLTTGEQSISALSKTTVKRYVRIPEIPAGQYDIKIVRISPENTTDFRSSSDFYLSGVDEIIYADFSYPNTAILGMKFLATDQLSGGIPNIVIKIRGRKVRVPKLTHNYNPIIATYNDCQYNSDISKYTLSSTTIQCSLDTNYLIWPKQWTQSPIWCLVDYLTNIRFGLGHYITDSLIDWAYAIAASKYSDTHISSSTLEESGFTTIWSVNSISGTTKCGTGTSPFSYLNFKGRYLKIRLDKGDFSSTTVVKLTVGSLPPGIYLNSCSISNSGFLLNILTTRNSITFTVDSSILVGSYILVDFGSVINFGSLDFFRSNSYVSSYVSFTFSTAGTEKRFQCDGVWDTPQSGFEAIVDFCKLFRAWAIWSEGKIKFIVDKDEDPVQLFNMSNIISGSFSQTFAAKSGIPNVIEVQFADKDNDYKLLTREIVDQDAWTAGDPKNKFAVSLKGITRQSQAVREGKFYLNTAKYRTKAITFKGTLDAVHCQAGDVIAFQHDVPQWAYGGRVVIASNVGNTITLDQVVDLSASTYKLYYQTPSGSFVTATVVNTTATRIITLSPVITTPTTPSTDALWSLGKLGAENKEFKIFSISRGENNEVDLSALEHNPSIYDDSGIAIPVREVSALPDFNAIPQVVTDLVLSILLGRPGFIISFNIPENDPAYSYAEIQLSDDGIHYYTYTTSSDARDIFVDGLPGQTKYIRIFSCNRVGRRSNYSVSGSILIQGDFYPANVTGLELFNGGNATDFEGRDCKVTWRRSEVYGGNSTSFSAGLNPYLATLDYKVEIWVNGIAIRSEITTDNWYLYTYEKNKEDNVTPAVTFTIKLYARSTSKTLSKTVASIIVTNTIPNDVSGLSAAAVVGGVQFAWDRNTESDFRCYSVRTKVGGGSWSSWGDVEDNKLIRILNASEISSSTNLAVVYAEVKVKDLYNQVSTTAATANAKANTISDNIFQLVPALDSGITGTASTLYNGVVASTVGGGVIIT